MICSRRPSPRTVAVLRALTAEPTQWRYGYELGQQLDLAAGSLYPVLIRLADQGLLEAAWRSRRTARGSRPGTGTG